MFEIHVEGFNALEEFRREEERLMEGREKEIKLKLKLKEGETIEEDDRGKLAIFRCIEYDEGGWCDEEDYVRTLTKEEKKIYNEIIEKYSKKFDELRKKEEGT